MFILAISDRKTLKRRLYYYNIFFEIEKRKILLRLRGVFFSINVTDVYLIQINFYEQKYKAEWNIKYRKEIQKN